MPQLRPRKDLHQGGSSGGETTCSSPCAVASVRIRQLVTNLAYSSLPITRIVRTLFIGHPRSVRRNLKFALLLKADFDKNSGQAPTYRRMILIKHSGG